MRYMIRRPTPFRRFAYVKEYEGKDVYRHVTDLSILRQCPIYSDQKQMESTYRMARLAKPTLNDYILKIEDLDLII